MFWLEKKKSHHYGERKMAADMWLEKDRWCSADVCVFCGGGRERKVANGGLRGGAGGCGEREMRGKKKNRNKRIFEFKFKVKSHMSSMACVPQMV